MQGRIEKDAYGEVTICDGAYWGPQTERSRTLFAIGEERLPLDVIRCFGVQKSAAAKANLAAGTLDANLADAIIQAADEMGNGRFDDQFPIALWQTGSGTQTNMNANEVIANRANEILGYSLGSRTLIHPNDHVNMGQSSNDTFPTIMHACVIRILLAVLAPATQELVVALEVKAKEFHGHVKLGMTHLQDALPVTLGMEFRTWQCQLQAAWTAIEFQILPLEDLAQGGTASGSGINGEPRVADAVADALSRFSGRRLSASITPSQFMAAHDGLAGLCGALNVMATVLLKICNDIRLLTSSLGGIPSMTLPDEGLSSSIMPAKRNATVCEAVIQVCFRVIGNSATVVAASGSSTLQLNTCKPLILNEVVNSIQLLSDAQRVLATGCVNGLQADAERLRQAVELSPVLGAVIAPVVGYDAAARFTKVATREGRRIRDVIVSQSAMTAEEYDSHLERLLAPDRLDKARRVNGRDKTSDKTAN